MTDEGPLSALNLPVLAVVGVVGIVLLVSAMFLAPGATNAGPVTPESGNDTGTPIQTAETTPQAGEDSGATTAAAINTSSATVGEAVTFDASNSTDVDGDITSYRWDFDGDGTTDATGPTNTHSYESNGTHRATLTVTDETGNTETTTVNVTVTETNDAPTAAITAAPASPTVGENVMIDALNSTDADGAIESYEWDLDGDGTTDETGTFVGHVYERAGTHELTLTVTDDDGAVNTTTMTVNVTNGDDGSSGGSSGGDDGSSGGSDDGDDGSSGGSDDGDDGSSGGSDDGDDGSSGGSDDGDDGSSGGSDDGDDGSSGGSDDGDTEQNDAPTAVATASPSATVGENITLNATESSDADGEIESYEWDVDGDGTVEATGATPNYSYESADSYNATVTVTDDDGATDNATVTVTVEGGANSAPAADATANASTVSVGETVTLNATASSDADGEIASYEWDVDGDGEVEATSATNSYSFDSADTYDVTVTVTDDDGATDNATVTVTVEAETLEPNDGPSSATEVGDEATYENLSISDATDADFFAVDVTAGGTISADVFFRHADGNLKLELWDDSRVRKLSLSFSDDESLEYTVDSGGTYYFAVSGHNGATNSYDIDITANSPPAPDATANLSTAGLGEPVTFDASGSTDPDGTIESYEWDVDGDGEVEVTDATNDYSYDRTGTYEATLTVTDDDGKTATDTVTISVEADTATPTVDASVNQTTAVAGIPVSFDGSESFDSDGSIERYEWEFGDNSTDTGETVTHTYESGGTYNATLTVVDDAGGANRTTVEITVEDPPSAQTAVYPTTMMVGEHFSLHASNSEDPDGSIESYEWDFDGDGTVDETGPITDHAYESAGSYDVTVTVTDDDGYTGTATVNVTAEAIPECEDGVDSDDDGLDDCAEIDNGTDPTEADTDRDGFPDGVEVNQTELLPDADPLQFDIYLEVDYIKEDPMSKSDWDTVEEGLTDPAFVNPDGSYGMNLHVKENDTIPLSNASGDDMRYYKNEYRDFRCAGYHYGVITTEDFYDDGGRGADGSFYVEGSDPTWTVHHELGHSLNLAVSWANDVYSGGFHHGKTYTEEEYQSNMNYDYGSWSGPLRFSDGTESDVAFDDWAFLQEHGENPGWGGGC
ncbi:PKD domain-containing protein [Haloarcula sp. S1CR25-12]|uniref:PKD domain-containing protein n=1 Tax=Haloarcula saliterrae TaxID=2950534 RepID=A0ABU2F707_9EURY|nr:PKD domain-containing protein [Haloarcula sp. S1CR25-12]MDS0258047.1 PKD domain-containing protein [Haloarcula sp. S1CR25-12]